MSGQGFDLQFTRHGAEGWRATFYAAGRAHRRPQWRTLLAAAALSVVSMSGCVAVPPEAARPITLRDTDRTELLRQTRILAVHRPPAPFAVEDTNRVSSASI
jgi:hypothetical protein